MLAKPLFGGLRKHWTGILLGFLAISSTGYGFGRWEAGQTFDGLTIFCASSTIVRNPVRFPNTTYGEFDVNIGFKNPNLFPVSVDWVANPVLNGSIFYGGLLQDVIPPLSSRMSTMPFRAVPPLATGYVINKLVSYERYSILGDIFLEPRVFFVSSDQNIPLGNDLMNLTANRVPPILWSVFIQHSNLLQSQAPRCP